MNSELREILSNHRFDVAMYLLHDRRRAGKDNVPCEMTHMHDHYCAGKIDLNEVLYPRRRFEKLDFDDQLKFYCPENCSLVCSTFHHKYGHSTAFREWFLKRMIRIYGLEHMQSWNNSLPLKTSRITIGDHSSHT